MPVQWRLKVTKMATLPFSGLEGRRDGGRGGGERGGARTKFTVHFIRNFFLFASLDGNVDNTCKFHQRVSYANRPPSTSPCWNQTVPILSNSISCWLQSATADTSSFSRNSKINTKRKFKVSDFKLHWISPALDWLHRPWRNKRNSETCHF